MSGWFCNRKVRHKALTEIHVWGFWIMWNNMGTKPMLRENHQKKSFWIMWNNMGTKLCPYIPVNRYSFWIMWNNMGTKLRFALTRFTSCFWIMWNNMGTKHFYIPLLYLPRFWIMWNNMGTKQYILWFNVSMSLIIMWNSNMDIKHKNIWLKSHIKIDIFISVAYCGYFFRGKLWIQYYKQSLKTNKKKKKSIERNY